MIRSRRLWELMELGRGVLDVTELTLLVGASLLVEAAHSVPSLNILLQLHPNDSLEQLPERLGEEPRYAALAAHIRTVLTRPGVDQLLGQLRYVASQLLSDLTEEEVWPATGRLFSELLGRFDPMRSGFSAVPDAVADLVVSPLNVTPYMRAFDPAAQAGQMLIALGRKLRSQGMDPNEAELLGHEASTFAAALGQLNLLLNQLPKATLVAADTLTQGNSPLGQYDAVISFPPFNADRVIDVERDPRFYRNRKGGKVKSESAYMQVGLAAVKPGGQAIFLLPTGVLFTGFYSQLRQAFAQEGIVTAAVHLAPGLLSGTAVALAVLVFDLPDRGSAKSSTLRLVDAENVGAKNRALRTLPAEAVLQIAEGIRGQAGDAVRVYEVSLAEQTEKDFIWLASAYEEQELSMESLAEIQAVVPAAVQRAKDTEAQVAKAMANLQRVLEAPKKVK